MCVSGNEITVSVIGCGYLGAVHAASMAKLGHQVIGIDVDAVKIGQLSRAQAPFFEPELAEILSEATSMRSIAFTTDFSSLEQATVHFLAVGTPQQDGSHAADLTFLFSAIDSLVPFLKPDDVVVGKSTVPVGTAAIIAEKIHATGAVLVWNPEFLREGFAVQDTIRPDRLVYGIPEGSRGLWATETLDRIYSEALKAGTPRIITDFQTAELVKVSANAFLATKISFINAIAEIAEVTGADVTRLAEAIGHDARIGHRFLGAGIGFGGGCLPKDIRAFVARAEELGRGSSLSFLKEVDAINLRRRERAVELVVRGLDDSPLNKKIAVLGASFKPHSDDIRDSPALDVAMRLKGLGAEVVVTDPQALENARRVHPQLRYEDERDNALRGADAVIVVTEWDEYRRELDPEFAGELVRGRVIVDGRNCLDPEVWRDAGWKYYGMGRP